MQPLFTLHCTGEAKLGWQCECGHGASVIVWLSFVKASSNLPALYVINLASVLALHSQAVICVFCKNSSHCCDSESSKPQETEISSYLKKQYFNKNKSLFMAFVWVRSGSYNWNMCIIIWGWKNECVSHLRVCCYLKHLLLLPVSAWRLPCCSVPARGALWSSSIKTCSPAKFITAKGRDGYEPTHQLQLHVEVRCELQVNSHMRCERWCLIPDSSFLHPLLWFGQGAVTARSA